MVTSLAFACGCAAVHQIHKLIVLGWKLYAHSPGCVATVPSYMRFSEQYDDNYVCLGGLEHVHVLVHVCSLSKTNAANITTVQWVIYVFLPWCYQSHVHVFVSAEV